jgi:hypothetical protein
MAREEAPDMVKPPLRTKSIGFKVSEEEYARLETAAQADGRTLGEWCRRVPQSFAFSANDWVWSQPHGVRITVTRRPQRLF